LLIAARSLHLAISFGAAQLDDHGGSQGMGSLYADSRFGLCDYGDILDPYRFFHASRFIST
jgi:hypothetical protein